jgi:hypothetical protein
MQLPQKNTSLGLPLPAGSMNDFGALWSASTQSFSIHMLSTNALPVVFWQSRQWQACTINGAAISRYRTAPQAHPPPRSISTLLVLSADLEGF